MQGVLDPGGSFPMWTFFRCRHSAVCPCGGLGDAEVEETRVLAANHSTLCLDILFALHLCQN